MDSDNDGDVREPTKGREVTTIDVRDLAHILRNELAIQILILLRNNEYYPRELAKLLGKSESQVSKVLRMLEDAGLVESRRVMAKKKSYKVYRLKVNEFKILIEKDGIVVRMDDRNVRVYSSRPLEPPRVSKPVGRDDLLRQLEASADKDVVFVVGPHGTGKTHLVAYYASNVEDRIVMYLRLTESYNIYEVSRYIASFLRFLGYDIDVSLFNAMTMRERLAEILSENRVLVVIDDIHKIQDREVARLIRYLAALSYSSDYNIILVGRSVEPNLAKWRARFMEIRVGPLSPQAFAELASKSAGVVEFTVEDAIQLSRSIPLLPILAKALGQVAARVGKREALQKIARMYYHGMLREIIDSDTAYMLIRLLSVTTVPVPREAACNALPYLEDCMHTLRQLELNGIVEDVDGRVKLHDFYVRIRDTIPPDEARLLKAALGRELVSGHEDLDKVQGLLLLAEACAVNDIMEIVEERMMQGSQWPFSNLNMYVRALDTVLSCSPPPRARKLLEAERAIMAIGFSNSLEVARRLLEAAEYYRIRVKPGRKRNTLVVRLYSLASIYFKQAGALEDAEKTIQIAYREAFAYEDVEPSAMTTLLNNMISLLLTLGKYSDALSVAEELVNLNIDDLEDYLYALSVKADLLRIEGRLEEAEQELLELWAAIKRLPSYEYKPLTFNVAWSLAYLYAEKGDFEKALYYARLNHERASRLAATIPQYREWADLYAADVAVIRALKGDLEEARKLFPKDKCKGREHSGLWALRCYVYLYLVEGERENLPPGRKDMVRIVEKYVRKARVERGPGERAQPA